MRQEYTEVFQVGERRITVTATEQIGPEDCFTMLLKAVLHPYATGEDVVPTISRDIKDAMLRQNLVI